MTAAIDLEWLSFPGLQFGSICLNFAQQFGGWIVQFQLKRVEEQERDPEIVVFDDALAIGVADPSGKNSFEQSVFHRFRAGLQFCRRRF